MRTTARCSSSIDAAPRMTVAATPAGNATIESWTVGFGREGPKRGIVIARTEAGERFVANTASDTGTLEQLIAAGSDRAARQGACADGINILAL